MGRDFADNDNDKDDSGDDADSGRDEARMMIDDVLPFGKDLLHRPTASLIPAGRN